MLSNKFKKSFISDRQVMLIILLNSLVLFLDAFPDIKATYGFQLYIVDYVCNLYFIVEMIFKIRMNGWKSYWSSGWNRFDFIIVMLSLPLVLSPIIDTSEFGVILILRVGRLFRFLRIAKFIPNQEHLYKGIKRALAASVGFIITLIIYNFILAIGATYLFSEADPQHFGNPMISIYSMFRIFTIEGWYELPDAIAQNSTPMLGILARIYFVFTVLTGGIIGLSMANAVFVDEMVMDNNDAIEEKLDKIREEIKKEFEILKTQHEEEKNELYTKLKDLLIQKNSE